MEAVLVERVENSLRQFMPRNAIFLCERLCAFSPSEANLQLLARCYLRNNQAYCAYHVLKGKQMPQSRYLFAVSCFQLNLLHEAEVALCPPKETNSEVPNGAAGHYLLGLIYRYTSRRLPAIDHFMQALTLDPLLWEAFEELCILGAAEDANEYFNDAATLRIQKQQLAESSSQIINVGNDDSNLSSSRTINLNELSPRQLKQMYTNTMQEVPSHPHQIATSGQATNSGSSFFNFCNTPSPNAAQISGFAPPPICRNAQLYANANAISGDGSIRPAVNAAVQAPRRKLLDEGKLRKVSGRLFSDSAPRRSTRLSGESKAENVPQAGGNGINHSSAKFLGGFTSSSSKTSSTAFRSVTLRKGQSWASGSLDEGKRLELLDDSRLDSTGTTSSSMPAILDARSLEQDRANSQVSGNVQEIANGIRELLSLLRILGEGYRLSCIYRTLDALEMYQKLPQSQYNTGWVLSQIGKAHFELVDYFEADRIFELSRQISPCLLEGMDIYSTVLYHLQQEMKLSYLAQELISIDRLSPQAWCAMGNCYSLQKDHETALKNFQRAVQLDSRFTYAHTLSGHEYVSMEDLENGIKCYQNALQVDERHYNSWYGLGVVFLRQEKFQFAEHHFRKAFLINPRSSVLMCYLGMALHALKRHSEALNMMERSILADKKNPLPLYQKASILFNLERYDEALNDLEQLREFAPRECSLYALMGKIYKRLNMHDKAMFNFGLALDMKPPTADVSIIKSAIEKLYLPDDIEDV